MLESGSGDLLNIRTLLPVIGLTLVTGCRTDLGAGGFVGIPASGSSASPMQGALPAPTGTGSRLTAFGNQSVPKSDDNTYTAGYAVMRDLGMTSIREGWNWKNLEVNKHAYVSWMNMVDDKATQFAKMGTKVQAMITDTPDWASSDPLYAARTTWDANSAGRFTVPAGLQQPIFADGTDVYKPGVGVNTDNFFAEYMFAMVSRYKGKVEYWQIWNEPDFPSGDRTAGTTGSTGGTRYWTGSVQDYVRLLQVAHTIAKGLDPQSKITLGGLGYAPYLAAIIDQGGASFFDVVDFHAYGSSDSQTTSNGVLNSDWGFLGRYHAMKQVLSEKGVQGKSFSCSETGFTADNPSEQASYVDKLFAAASAQGDLELLQWGVFTNPGFNHIGLLDQTLRAKTPGYTAFQFASRQLTGAQGLGPVQADGVQGYRFKRADGKMLYVVWASGARAQLTLSLGSAQVYDQLGNPTSDSTSHGALQLALGTQPVFVLSN